MSPADIVRFETQALKDGRPVKVYVEHQESAPLSRPKLLEMVLAASLLFEEAQPHVSPSRLRRRMELLRERMEDAMERESHAQSVVASKPALPTVEDFTE